MGSEYFDEEGLLKVIKAFELSEAITKLNWNWNNYPNPIKDAHELISTSQKLLIEISEYDQRLGSKLSENQKNQINNSVEDLGKLISYIKNKIKPTESLEIVNQTSSSLM
jgi:hypothetical protein